jgi:prolyl-tRNA synthetase
MRWSSGTLGYTETLMFWSRLFIPTRRETPSEADTVSQQLLLRAGYVRHPAAGSNAYLFLARRVLSRITKIVREEMEAIGGQEMLLPALHPADRKAGGKNAEELFAAIAGGELRSYRNLPQTWYQVGPAFREEARSKSGMSRALQSLEAESYFFAIDAAGLETCFQRHAAAFSRILDRCGIRCVVATGSQSVHFLAISEAGEDSVVRCSGCGSAQLPATAQSRATAPSVADPEGDFDPEPFHTPDRKTIADVAAFTGLPESSQMKSLVLVADGRPLLAMLRGDHSLNETKFAQALQVAGFRPAYPDEIRNLFGAEPGSLGPAGVKNLRTIADTALKGRRNMIAGANRDDYHLRNVTPGEDFNPEYFDLRQVVSGDACVHCGGALELSACFELASHGKLGARDVLVTNEAGADVSVAMGSSRIEVERILVAAIEQHHDRDGMTLPAAIAPFDVVVTPVNVGDNAQRRASEEIYQCCTSHQLQALLDDRDERPGVKFKDADLIGVPYRITVGKKLSQGMVEVADRRAKTSEDVAKENVSAYVAEKVRA